MAERVKREKRGFDPISPEQIAQNAILSEAGQEQLARGARLAKLAADPRERDKPAVISSEAETGWVFCARHGHARALDARGKWAPTGCCEFCFKATYSPAAIAARRKEVGDAAGQEFARQLKERERIEAKLERESFGAVDGPDAEGADEEPDGDPVDAGADAGVGRLPGDAEPLRVVEHEGVDPRAAARGPAPGPDDGESDLAGQWLRLTEMD